MLVLERFFDLSTQDAADMTSEIANSRQHQFENTASTEVPAMLEEEGLTAAERHAVALYVKGLQDWQAGCHEWHLRSSRYTSDGEKALVPTGPTGLGTSAARVKLTPTTTGLTRLRRHTHVPYDRVSPPQLPAFCMPFAVHVNRHEAEATRTCAGWCRAMGMLATPPGLPNAGIWTEQLLEELAIVEAASRISSTSSRASSRSSRLPGRLGRKQRVGVVAATDELGVIAAGGSAPVLLRSHPAHQRQRPRVEGA